MKYDIKSIWQNYKLEYLILLLILCIAFFFRFYNTPQRYGFDSDPTRDALVIFQALQTGSIPLVGAQSGIASINFGPWYYYQLIIFNFIFPFMYSPWIYIGLTSVLAVFLMFKIGEMLEGTWFGLLLAFLMALTPSETGQTQGLSNPNLIPFYSTLVLWIFLKLMKEKTSPTLIFLFGLTLGVGINIHYQFICFLLLPLAYFFIKKELFLKKISIFVIGILLTFIPLLLFNLENHWNTISGSIYYLTKGRTGTYIPNSWKIYLLNFWLPYWSYVLGVSNIFGVLMVIFTTIIIAFSYFKKKLNKIYFLLGVIFLAIFIFLRYFISQRDYYYYLFLHPLLLIFFALAIWQLRKNGIGLFFGAIVLAIITFGMVNGDIQRLSTRQDFIETQNLAKALNKTYPNTLFVFYSCDQDGKTLAQGLDFFLLHFNNLNLTQKHNVGIIGSYCQKTFQNYPRFSKQAKFKLNGKILVDIGNFSEKDISSKGWKLVNAQTIYHDTVAWWN